MVDIKFDDFKKLDIRIGEIKEAEKVPKSRNLIKLVVDFGFEKRQCIAGLLNYYEPKDIVNKKFAFLMNLEKRKLMGIESQCMILAAEDNTGNVTLITPDKDIALGSKIM
ncbi:methionine--tRNA ligase subunit beta [Candidatus Bathyarchaeota archaeon]|nr:methionine--tRNA ligase subunit beta [Candidatus Bathyarchaeota archaeon]